MFTARPPLPQPKYLPIQQAEAKKLWNKNPDIILVSADAYVDHPSFPTALLGRTLIEAGYSVAVISQPDWKDRSGKSFAEFGKPNLFFAVVPGAVDPEVDVLDQRHAAHGHHDLGHGRYADIGDSLLNLDVGRNRALVAGREGEDDDGHRHA